MSAAKRGDTVQVHYTGKLEDGSVFDSSRERAPITFEIGRGQVIPGFEKAVVGMAVGETRTEAIEPEHGYGERVDDLLLEVPPANLPDDFEPKVGQQLSLQREGGQNITVRVAGISDDAITLDANHPLAGQVLTFEITLVGIA